MKYDAISFAPSMPFRLETAGNEFETNLYCLSFEGGVITLHLKLGYFNTFLSNIPPENRQIRKWHYYMTHLNCIYLLLDSLVMRDLQISYFDIEEITTKNSDVVSENGITFSASTNRTLLIPTMQAIQIPQLILNEVNLAFSKLVLEFEQVYTLSELTKSLAAYKSADFTTSLVFAWFLLEKFIEIRWISYLEAENQEFENGQRRINADRKKSLNDHRSYPVSVKLQMLELAKKISFKQFSDLDLLREKRNEIVHPKKKQKSNLTTQNDPDSCILAFDLLQQFLETDFDLQIVFNKSYSHLGVFDR